VIKKNMPLPARTRKVYYTTRPNQDKMVLEIVQYRDAAQDVISLGQLVVGPLPSPRQNYPIELEIQNLEDSTLAVRAYDPQTRVELMKEFGQDSQDGVEHLARQRLLVQSTFLNVLS
jgi:hypothetical protein